MMTSAAATHETLPMTQPTVPITYELSASHCPGTQGAQEDALPGQHCSFGSRNPSSSTSPKGRFLCPQSLCSLWPAPRNELFNTDVWTWTLPLHFNPAPVTQRGCHIVQTNFYFSHVGFWLLCWYERRSSMTTFCSGLWSDTSVSAENPRVKLVLTS